MKKRPTPQKAESSALNTRKFTGTDNPRHLRVILALLARPRRREDIDDIAGCSNGPDLVSDLRDLFPGAADRNEYIDCTRIKFLDRDGKPCRPGVYSITEKGCRLIYAWLAKRKGSANAKRP